ncbi:hypothetical protein GcM1_247096 [Golovinomyces cichoracearum]|uniref:Uncharacterized protein n=1 Tax=Golovinomyces cichoracearum TaxID=62708 RepID=A0A420IDL0_9PEZI|nr:hypothetical protein GcM1_247096 [Golovinomyces cichoracearum]
MPTFIAPSITSDITRTNSGGSIESFRTASNSRDSSLRHPNNTMGNIGKENIGREEMILDEESGPSSRSVRTDDEFDIKSLIIRMEARD